MAGFFGLFGSKTKYVDEKDSQANGDSNEEAFFLSSDEAKSLGKKIENMGKSSKNQVTEIIKEVSSILKGSSQEEETPRTNEQLRPKTESKKQSAPSRRVADSSMDLFRKMAREIKK